MGEVPKYPSNRESVSASTILILAPIHECGNVLTLESEDDPIFVFFLGPEEPAKGSADRPGTNSHSIG